MLQVINAVMDWIITVAGVTIMMPIIIFVLGVIFRAPLGKSFRAAVSIGVGFTGLFLILVMLIEGLAPATKAMAERFGLGLTIPDIGWPVLAAISFGTPWAFTVFLAVFALNIILILARFTKTLTVDLWNYWSHAYVFSMVWVVTHSIPLATIGALVYAAFCFKLADWTVPIMRSYFGMPGISLPHGDTVIWAPMGFALNALWDRIPRIRDIKIEPEAVQRRLGIMGEPMIVGLFMGLLIGILAWFRIPLGGDNVASILKLAMTTAAFMVLMPRMIALLMEGLIPISESVRDFMLRRFPGRELYIGLDAAIVVGFPAIVATALILTPVAFLIAAILPGNATLPFADLAVFVFLLIWAVASSGGNIFRGILNGIFVFIPLVLLVSTDVAPVVTLVAHEVGAEVPEAQTITAMAAGFKTLSWPILQLLWFVGGYQNNLSAVFLAIGYLAVFGFLWWIVRKHPEKIAKQLSE